MSKNTWSDAWDDFTLWLGLHGFATEVPFRGCSGRRRFRFDFANAEARVAVDYDGRGVGHQSISGTWADAAKGNEAQVMGWILLRCNVKTVSNGECIAWVETALKERA